MSAPAPAGSRRRRRPCWPPAPPRAAEQPAPVLNSSANVFGVIVAAPAEAASQAGREPQSPRSNRPEPLRGSRHLSSLSLARRRAFAIRVYRGHGSRLDTRYEPWFTSLPMAYRSTERTEARRAEVRERIVAAALELIAEGGYVERPGRRRGRAGRRRRRHRLPLLPLQVRALRRGLQGGLAARGRRDARGGRRPRRRFGRRPDRGR